MSSRSGEFAAYVPGTVLRRLQRNPVCAASGEGWRGLAVALFADVAGSTKMANRLAKLGRLVGPEEMCRILNAYYSPLISKLHDRGGDVVGFAGDAVMAVWHAEDESAIKAAVRQAAQAAIEIQRDLNNMELAAGVRLSLRICLGAGELSMALVGGRQGFHQLIAYGPPLDQIRAAGDALRIGEVYLSREAKNYLGGGAALDAQPDGSAFVRRLTSPPSPERAAPLDAASLPEESLRLFVPRAVQESVDAGVSEFLDQARTVSTLFVRIARPTGMLPQWERMQTAMSVLQEAMARYEGTVAQLMEDDKGLIAVLAFGLPPLGHEDDAARAIDAAVYLREKAHEYNVACGTGVSTGLPFCGPLGSPERRVYTVTGADVIRAARLMQMAGDGDVLCDRETHAAARKATSHGFAPLPRFTLKGFDDPVRVFKVVEGLRSTSSVERPSNLERPTVVERQLGDGFARPIIDPSEQGEASFELSSLADYIRAIHATPDESLLATNETTALAELARRLHAERLGEGLLARLQSIAAADADEMRRECERLLAADRLVVELGVCELLAGEAEPSERIVEPAAALIGRRAERAALIHSLSLLRAETSRVAIVEGETGVGKSRLLEELRAAATELGVACLVSRCSSVEIATPYFPWRQVFQERFALTDRPTAAERVAAESRVLAALETHPRSAALLPFAPLLNDLLGLALPEGEIVKQLSGQPRADNLHDVLIALLETTLDGRPTLIEFEDMQWADSASWRLVKLVRERVGNVLIALSVRPVETPFPAEYEQFIAAEWTDRIALDALSEADSQELATVRLEAQSLALPLAELIWRRTQGNPLFIEQVVDHMTAAGLVEVREGIATLTSAADSGIEHAVPDTIRGLIAARIDRLRQTHQLTAKVSSVIGPLFAGRTLAAVYPDPAAAANLPEHVDALLQERIVRLDRPRPDDAYEFPHPVLQQVCYEMLPSVHRRRLHKIAAEWFQRDEAGGPLPYRLIAHHWGRAGDVAKQIEFLALAGDAAMRDGAFREAVTGFSEVLRLSREQTPDRPSQALVAQRAHWEYQLGQGRFGLGDLPGALDHLRESLRLRKRIARTSKVGLICDSLWLVARQAARRLWPTRWLSFAANRLGWKAKPKEEADQAGREAAAAYLRLSRVHYYMNNILPGTNATLRSLDLAESFGPSPELAIAYGTMMILCGLLNWGRAARVYSRLAEATTRAVGDIHNRAVVLSYLSMFHLGQGDFERVEALALESLELAEKLGDHQQSGEDATLLAMLGCLRADYAAAERWAERLLEASKRSGNAMHAGWALNILGEAHLRLRRPTEAVARLRESADKLRGNNDRTEEIRIHGMLAELAARAGDWDEAATQADAAEAIASAATAKTCSTLEGLAGIAEARFLRWEQAPPGSLPADVKRLAQQALRWLQQYARLYPVGRPRLSVFEGRWHRLTGAPLKAHQIWRDGLEQAVQLRMPYEAAVLHEWIASHYPEDSPERQEHLDEAALLFRQIGAPV